MASLLCNSGLTIDYVFLYVKWVRISISFFVCDDLMRKCLKRTQNE